MVWKILRINKMVTALHKIQEKLRKNFFNIPGLGDKKKYYVEILIDDKLYARTSSKKITDACCMWCESFSFADLPTTTEKITLLVHKDKGGQSTSAAANSRKKPKKPVGRVKISVGSVTSRCVFLTYLLSFCELLHQSLYLLIY